MEVVGKDGRYELRSQILQDARGTLHRGWDRRRRQSVLVRLFDAPPAAALDRYAAVAAAVRSAAIPGVLAPLEVVAGSAPFTVFTAPDGDSLASLLHEGALQWARAAAIVTALAKTLAAVASAIGYRHGRLDPGAVWIATNGDALAIDFGGAELGAAGPVQRDSMLLEYRAPEQIIGAPTDDRTEVFALGVLLVELTTGLHPFAGLTAFQAAHKLTQTPPDLTELTRGMSWGGAREANKLLEKALARDPTARHPNPRAFADALDYVRGLAGAPTPQRPQRAPPAPVPAPIPMSLDEHTTIQGLPGTCRPRLAHTAAEPPSPTPTPTPALTPTLGNQPTYGHKKLASPPPVLTPATAARPEAELVTREFRRPQHEPVDLGAQPIPADRTERLSERLSTCLRPAPADRTERLPETFTTGLRPVPVDRTERLPASPDILVFGDSPLTSPVAAPPCRRAAPFPTDIADMTLVLPASPHPERPASNGAVATVRDLVPPRRADDTTLRLLDAELSPASEPYSPHAADPREPPGEAASVMPPPAVRAHRVLIAINVLGALLVLIGLAIIVGLS